MTPGRWTAAAVAIAVLLAVVVVVAGLGSVRIRTDTSGTGGSRPASPTAGLAPNAGPSPSPSPDLTVRVIGAEPGKSGPGALTVAGIAAAVSLITTFGAQGLVRRFERGRRRSTRQTARLDGLIVAVQDLEVAYANDALTADPDVETQVELLRASRAFDRAVALVSDTAVKALAGSWQRLAEREALERGSPTEEGTVTQQDIAAADTALMEKIRALEDRLE